jgi:hypothetical protein
MPYQFAGIKRLAQMLHSTTPEAQQAWCLCGAGHVLRDE